MKLWTRDTALLLALILNGMTLLIVHVAVWLRTLHAPGVPRLLRWVSWLPPFTPVAGFMSGHRFLAFLWCVVVTLYIVLRSQA